MKLFFCMRHIGAPVRLIYVKVHKRQIECAQDERYIMEQVNYHSVKFERVEDPEDISALIVSDRKNGDEREISVGR